jgi:DNA ligase (NAD+)
LEPVKINGVLIERATLHNENEVNRLGVKLGDKVRLKRAGDVIPKIVAVEDSPDGADPTTSTRPAPYQLPDRCPECGSPTERLAAGEVVVDASAVGELFTAVTVRCTGGTVCPAQVMEQIRFG